MTHRSTVFHDSVVFGPYWVGADESGHECNGYGRTGAGRSGRNQRSVDISADTYRAASSDHSVAAGLRRVMSEYI